MLTGSARRGAHASDAETTEGGTAGVAQALRDALSKDAMRIIALFKEWDEDRNGSVSKKEWCAAATPTQPSPPPCPIATGELSTPNTDTCSMLTPCLHHLPNRRKAIPLLGLDVPKAMLSAELLNQVMALPLNLPLTLPLPLTSASDLCSSSTSGTRTRAAGSACRS